MPGAYTLHEATGNPDNGFDIFADVPTDDDDDDVIIDEMFDDSITAPVPTYQLPAESPDSNSQAVVLQDDLLKHFRISHKYFSSLTLCMRAQLHVTGEQLQRMLERSPLRRACHSALLEADKATAIPLSSLRKLESTLEQLCRRSSSFKGSSVLTMSSSVVAAGMDLQADSEASLILHLSKMSLTHRNNDVSGEEEEEEKCDVKVNLKLTSGVTSKPGAMTVLGERVPASALTVSGGGEKSATVPWIKREKGLIAPSSLTKHLSLPSSHGFTHSSASQFSRNWSRKLSPSHFFGGPIRSASTSVTSASPAPSPSTSYPDKPTLCRSQSDKFPASSEKRYFAGLFPDRTTPSHETLGKLAGQIKSETSSVQTVSQNPFSSFQAAAASSSSNPFSAFASYSGSKYAPLTFKTAAFQGKTFKAEQAGGSGEGGESDSSVLTFSPSGHAAQGRGQGQSRSAHNAPKGGATGTTQTDFSRSSQGAAFSAGRHSSSSDAITNLQSLRLSHSTASFSDKGAAGFNRGAHSSPGNPADPQSLRLSHSGSSRHGAGGSIGGGGGSYNRGTHGSVGHSSGSFPGSSRDSQSSRQEGHPPRDPSGFNRGLHSSVGNAQDHQSAARESQSLGGRHSKRSNTFPPSPHLPYSKNIPPGLNPSVVIKTSGSALSAVGGLGKSSSQSAVAMASSHGHHGKAGSHTTTPSSTGGRISQGYHPSSEHGWKADVKDERGIVHKPRWSNVGARASSASSRTSSMASSTASSPQGREGSGMAKWSRPSYPSYPPSSSHRSSTQMSSQRPSPHVSGAYEMSSKMLPSAQMSSSQSLPLSSASAMSPSLQMSSTSQTSSPFPMSSPSAKINFSHINPTGQASSPYHQMSSAKTAQMASAQQMASSSSFQSSFVGKDGRHHHHQQHHHYQQQHYQQQQQQQQHGHSRSSAWQTSKHHQPHHHQMANVHGHGGGYPTSMHSAASSATPPSASSHSAPFSSTPYTVASSSSNQSMMTHAQAQTAKTSQLRDSGYGGGRDVAHGTGGRLPQWSNQRSGSGSGSGSMSSMGYGSHSSSNRSSVPPSSPSPMTSSTLPSSAMTSSAHTSIPHSQSYSSSMKSSSSSLSSVSSFKQNAEAGKEATNARPAIGGGVRTSTTTNPPSNSSGGGAKSKTLHLDFDQMFSDESSNSSFTTVVDNIDYDSSRSPATPASGAATTNATPSSFSTSTSHYSVQGKDSSASMAVASGGGSGGGKGYGVGAFGSVGTGKDRNDNDIALFPSKS
ncbi:pneumococcal serine-rich repeat protein-like [Littorina saxatilis]|uniref:pneumococcal serine-rich repeat protein-like n=1 Tax=Littorina saxatilis TaxID=31220 RepID=UPI0038B530CA